MSKPHLRALDEALTRGGWQVVAVHAGDDYRISASWEIRRSSKQPSLFIDFDGMGLGGDGCLPLEESYGCLVRGRESVTLYFYRINKSRPLWESQLTAFVEALNSGK